MLRTKTPKSAQSPPPSPIQLEECLRKYETIVFETSSRMGFWGCPHPRDTDKIPRSFLFLSQKFWPSSYVGSKLLFSTDEEMEVSDLLSFSSTDLGQPQPPGKFTSPLRNNTFVGHKTDFTADPMHQNTCLVIFGTATKLRQIAIVITAIGNKWS